MSLLFKLFETDDAKGRLDLLKQLVDKSTDFSEPLDPESLRRFERLIGSASNEEMKKFRKHSKVLAGMTQSSTENPLEGIKKQGSKYIISHKDKHGNNQDFELSRRSAYDDPEVDHIWRLKHIDSDRDAGEFRMKKDGEVKWSEIYQAFKGTGIGKKVYAALAKDYGSLVSDIRGTSPSAKGVYSALGRRGPGWVRDVEGPYRMSRPIRSPEETESSWNLRKTPQVREKIQIPNITKNIGKLRKIKEKTAPVSMSEADASVKWEKVLNKYAKRAPSYEHPMDGVERTSKGYNIALGGTIYKLNRLSGDDEVTRWRLLDNDKQVGAFTTSDNAEVLKSKLEPGVKGRGLGTKVYAALIDHHGRITSDPTYTSPDARRVYKSLEKRGWARPTGAHTEAEPGEESEIWSAGPVNIKQPTRRLKSLRAKSVN
jgi:hypothetical protein